MMSVWVSMRIVARLVLLCDVREGRGKDCGHEENVKTIEGGE